MIKFKLKFLVPLFIIMLLISTVCLADDSIMMSSETITSDLSILKNSNLTNSVEGNAFGITKDLIIDPSGNIAGDLFVIANSVTLKSNVEYSTTEKDELGNDKIYTINNFSSISGNAYIIANSFTLEPGCEINGDLFILANEVNLGQNAKIYGNVFAKSNNFYLNSQISGDLYLNSENFTMDYYGFIYRDLHLNSQNSYLNGYVYRTSFIDSKKIETGEKFINKNDFNIQKSNKSNLEKGSITGTINYESSSSNILSSIIKYLLELITFLIFLSFIYFIASKLKIMDCLNKNVKITNLLKLFAIGLLVLIVAPLVSILLLISTIGSTVGSLIFAVYFLLLAISQCVFILFVSNNIKAKKPIFKYLYVLALGIIVWLISLVPYIGSIITLITNIFGFGLLTEKLFKKKNK